MEKSKTKVEDLPPQKFLRIKKSEKSKAERKKKLYNFMDINLNKSFLNNYFQQHKKK